MMKKAIKDVASQNPSLEKLIPLIKQNIGFVVTNGDLKEIRDLIQTYKVPAAARAGAISPCNVTVPSQATTLGPEKTSFFQALSIPTKITRGMIEITANVPLLQVGVKVGQSEATLLQMLNIKPFQYGFDILQVYDSAGKLRAQRAKAMKFSDGYMIKAGNPCRDFIDTAVRHVLLRQGVLGIKVNIMLPFDPQGKTGPKTPMPDKVVIAEPPKDDVIVQPP